MAGVFRRSGKSSDIGGVTMEEYLKILLEQIRCKKACPRIVKEVRDHIEEQAKANQTEWMMDEEEAMKCAIRDMGDPVEAGVALDRIHRPKIAWDIVALMAVVSMISLVIHIVIGIHAGETQNQAPGGYILHAAVYIGAGFLCMMLVYRLDYSIFAGYGKIAAVLFLAFFTLEIFFTGEAIDGSTAYMQLGSIRISLAQLIFLYVPVFGAVLYQYHGSGWAGVFQILLFMFYPVWLAFRMPRINLAFLLLLILSAMFTVAVWKNWFRIPKKIFLTVYWGILTVFPAVFVFFAVKSTNIILTSYREDRLKAFFGGRYDEYDYVTKTLLDILKSSRILGAGKETVFGNLPDYHKDYILTFLSSYYGIAAACIVCLLVAAVGIRAFQIAFGQGNRLGMIMGAGSSLVLLSNTLFNVMENMGILPRTSTFLPFFSYTGTGMIVSYILMGIVLSVYRYKNILPADGKKKEAKRQCV